MDPRKLFTDERHSAYCVDCAAMPSSADHVPSKALLDDPLPLNLPVVGACETCNQRFSQDEEYVAALVECVICDSAEPTAVSRTKIARKLRESPKLASRIAAARRSSGSSGQPVWEVEVDRVRNVLLKLARGHIAYEFGETALDEPTSVWFGVLGEMTGEEREAFETPPAQHVLPEVGSRAFLRAVAPTAELLAQDWQIVQEGRYRYLAAPSNGIVVRIVLSEYLGCEVRWS